MTAKIESRFQAHKAPFEAFGMLYYPLFAQRADLEGLTLDDADMAWAVTANTNLEGTGYTLSQQSVIALAAYRHRMATLATDARFLPLAEDGVNPLEDVRRLVPDVKASPMYPDFPSQVMEMDEATYRYHQQMHYASTYGVELVAGLLGLQVEVGEGWLPDVEATPKTDRDETLASPKVLHVALTVEDLRNVVEARLARATRMHPSEIETALLVFTDLGDEGAAVSFPKVAFHENMMELIRVAGERGSDLLERVATGMAQHPGDLLKATLYLRDARGKKHLATRQKKGLCRSFEHFSVGAIAQNIADAGKRERRAPNYLSLERFAGPCLREACELVSSGQVVSWASTTEQLWMAVNKAKEAETEAQKRMQATHKALPTEKAHAPLDRSLDKNAASPLEKNDAAGMLHAKPSPKTRTIEAWKALLAHYGTKPGMLFRSLNRLAKGGCPFDMLRKEVLAHAASYSLPTLVRTLTIMSERAPHYRLTTTGFASSRVEGTDGRIYDDRLVSFLHELVLARLQELKTPLAGKRVYLDEAGISLEGSILMPNDTGNTGTAWPPVGMAWVLPDDGTVRFFTFWDDNRKRVDVDLHFHGVTMDGKPVHIGWNGGFSDHGMTTSGDVTTSKNSVEYLDARMEGARNAGVHLVVQQQHIYDGTSNWADIDTCYSGAMVVKGRRKAVKLYNAENVLFRDDLTGEGRYMSYAVVNFPGHYVRILRGANMPVGDVAFSLGAYLEALFEAQGATRVETPEEAELKACVGRSDDPAVISLFDEGFFLG